MEAAGSLGLTNQCRLTLRPVSSRLLLSGSMSRIAIALVALALLGCSNTEPLAPVDKAAEERETLLLSTVHVADPRAFEQLLGGFHQLEGGSWRWTEREFSVLLEPPPPVPLHSSSLEFHFSVPEATIAALGSVTITARLNGVELGSETISQAAQDIVFIRPVPSALLEMPPLRASFYLDNVMAPTPQDQRELGIIAISIALR